MLDILSTIQAQFANSPRLLSIIETFNDAIDPSALVDEFYANVWNIDTAVGFGLDVWGRIVGVGRVLTIPMDTSTETYFGFAEGVGGGRIDTFGAATFIGGPAVTTNFSLLDDDYRTLILVKALSNITDRSSKAINRSLMLLFPGRGNAYIDDNLDMSINYRFTFELTTVERAILTQSGVIPRPAGVLVTFYGGDLLKEDGGFLLTESGAGIALEI